MSRRARTPWTIRALALLLGLAAAGRTAAQEGQAPEGQVTFTRDIAPIVFRHCAACHRPDQVAPFPLLTYRDVAARAVQIGMVTRSGYMPPWKAAPRESGAFVGERRLSDRELDLLQRWIEQGTPEGDPGDLPPRPEFPEGWQLGRPDLVVTMPEPFELPAEGQDVFRNFVIPTASSEVRYVRAVEFRPSNRRVVHHANLRVDTSGTSRLLDGQDGQPGFTGMAGEGTSATGQLVGWHPGRMPLMNPPEVAWELEPGADLVLASHLLPTGKPEEISFTLGLYLSDRPPTTHSLVIRVASKTLDIPAGEASYVARDSFELPVDVRVFSMRPHAHYLGKDLRGYARLPDGIELPLIRIPDWDFNWQEEYRPEEPIPLPAGSTIEMEYVYDNSTDNVRNPHQPPQRVHWGPNTEDEMGVLFTHVLVDREADADRLLHAMADHERQLNLAGWEKRLESDPDNAEFQRSVALQLRLQNRHDDAIAALREALRLDPDDAATHNDLGLLLALAQQRYDEAIVHLREAVRLDPASAASHRHLANVLLAKGEPREALAELRETLRLDERDTSARLRLAELLSSAGRLDEAIEHYRRVVERAPQHARARAGLGLAYHRVGKLDAAIEHLRVANRIEPGDAEWHRALAGALEQEGDLAGAVVEFRAAARLRPDWALPRRRLAWILATHPDPSVRDPAEALEHAEQASRLAKQDNATVRDTLAAAYAAAGRYAEAVANAERALQLVPPAWTEEQVGAIRERLALYRRGKPYVEGAPAR